MIKNSYQDDLQTTTQKIEKSAEEALIQMYWDDPVKFKKRVKKLSNEIITQEVFWMPKGVDSNRKIPLSVPGAEPPKNSQEHRERLYDHLRKLAQELEDEDGKGAVYRAAVEMIQGESMRMEGPGMTPDTLIQLMQMSDHVYIDSSKKFSRNQALQQDCKEMGLEERLATIGLPY